MTPGRPNVVPRILVRPGGDPPGPEGFSRQIEEKNLGTIEQYKGDRNPSSRTVWVHVFAKGECQRRLMVKAGPKLWCG